MIKTLQGAHQRVTVLAKSDENNGNERFWTVSCICIWNTCCYV